MAGEHPRGLRRRVQARDQRGWHQPARGAVRQLHDRDLLPPQGLGPPPRSQTQRLPHATHSIHIEASGLLFFTQKPLSIVIASPVELSSTGRGNLQVWIASCLPAGRRYARNDDTEN